MLLGIHPPIQLETIDGLGVSGRLRRREEAPERPRAELQLQQAPPCEVLLHSGQQNLQRPPELPAHGAAGVLAEPGRAHGHAMRPDAAAAIVEMVRTAKGMTRAKAVRAVGIQKRVGGRCPETQRCDRHPSIEPDLDRASSGSHAGVCVRQDRADKEVGQAGQVRAAARRGIEVSSTGVVVSAPPATITQCWQVASDLGRNGPPEQLVHPALVQRRKQARQRLAPSAASRPGEYRGPHRRQEDEL